MCTVHCTIYIWSSRYCKPGRVIQSSTLQEQEVTRESGVEYILFIVYKVQYSVQNTVYRSRRKIGVYKVSGEYTIPLDAYALKLDLYYIYLAVHTLQYVQCTPSSDALMKTAVQCL